MDAESMIRLVMTFKTRAVQTMIKYSGTWRAEAPELGSWRRALISMFVLFQSDLKFPKSDEGTIYVNVYDLSM